MGQFRNFHEVEVGSGEVVVGGTGGKSAKSLGVSVCPSGNGGENSLFVLPGGPHQVGIQWAPVCERARHGVKCPRMLCSLTSSVFAPGGPLT